MKALLVDDVADMRELLAVIMAEWNIECLHADNGAQALKILAADPSIAFCTVDIHMPVMDGFSFVRAVRQDDAFAAVKLIMVSTDVDKGSVDQALQLGADEYIMKPFMRDMVDSKLRILGLI
jgi:two-component system chemotaxis response regulator CheY